MADRADIRVISPGMLSTVQDLGRAGHSAIGVGRGGAADALSLRVGNRLVGNPDDAAAIEMTWTGGVFRFERDAFVVLAGGNGDSRHCYGNQLDRLPRYRPKLVRSGDRIVVGPIQSGVRTYLCVAGGIDVPIVLGSRSTHLVGAFGGWAGRPLRENDVLSIGATDASMVSKEVSEGARQFCETTLARRTLRAATGPPHADFRPSVIDAFWRTRFEVSMRSDRTGLRLQGGIGGSSFGGRMASEGMMTGAVQVPESGEPIVLGVDHPTTGGYPVIACVAAVDHPVLGQIRPGEQVRFERISLAQARELHHEQKHALNDIIPPQGVDQRTTA